jgi:DNA-binding transcriptional LysR family regulator
MDVDTARLRAFAQVAERGTVAAAAAHLGYTAPAVSQQITKLEAQLGAALFDRVGGRLRLSPAGERLLPLAHQVLDLTSQAERAAEPAPEHRHVVIAGFASALSTLVVPLLRSRLARRVSFEIQEAEDDDALRNLRLGQVDIALSQEYDGAPVDRSARLAYTPLLQDRLRLVAPPAHPPSVRLDQLAGTAWLENGSGTRCAAATQSILRAAGITPVTTGRIADNRTLLQLVAAGHGATITPELVLRDDPADVTVARADLGASRTILAVTRAAAAHELADLVDGLAAIGRRRRPRRPPHPRPGRL